MEVHGVLSLVVIFLALAGGTQAAAWPEPRAPTDADQDLANLVRSADDDYNDFTVILVRERPLMFSNGRRAATEYLMKIRIGSGDHDYAHYRIAKPDTRLSDNDAYLLTSTIGNTENKPMYDIM